MKPHVLLKLDTVLLGILCAGAVGLFLGENESGLLCGFH